MSVNNGVNNQGSITSTSGASKNGPIKNPEPIKKIEGSSGRTISNLSSSGVVVMTTGECAKN